MNAKENTGALNARPAPAARKSPAKKGESAAAASKAKGGRKAARTLPYFNRELGILAFNERVLAQAADMRNPLLERLRFLCIVSSNLDEFFEIRLAGLKEQVRIDPTHREADGMPVGEVLTTVRARVEALLARQYQLFNDVILPQLEEAGVNFLYRPDWSPALQAWARKYFDEQIFPVLTPIGLDPAHPFPRVLNKSLNIAIELEGRDAFGRDARLAIVQAPRALPRLIALPAEFGPNAFVLLSTLLIRFASELFPGITVRGCHPFRATRNSDLFVDEEEVTNLRLALQGELPQRHFGDAVRLEVNHDTPDHVVNFLLDQFGLEEVDLYRAEGPVNLARLMQLADAVERPDLKFAPFVANHAGLLDEHEHVFDIISAGDILLHHPFESFDPVLDFVRACATDPAVVAIKQTIYRTGAESELMELLIKAARAGKEVTVVVELMARFDEETNINWAARLEQAGAHVVYGVVGHKTHAKMCLVVRREGGRMTRYVHLGTGNYHPRTARLYTDFGLITADRELCADSNEVFRQLTGVSQARKLARIWQAPFSMHDNVLAAIRNEVSIAQAGGKGRIVAKMNALLEPKVIAALYAASQAGVKVELIIRGACALVPGVPGISENIRVVSAIGRFLEHSRVYWFENGGDATVYLSSADWMDRNFFRRVEVAYPVLDPKLKKRVFNEGLGPYLRRDAGAWELKSDGEYVRRVSGPTTVQERLLATLSKPAAPGTLKLKAMQSVLKGRRHAR
ncbi:MAG TPA: polyphosphate kinase 1 [Burkholderiales bacterium]|jgi:polyphosphate kinase